MEDWKQKEQIKAVEEAGGSARTRYHEDDPARWEWDYRGTPAERAELEERVLREQPTQEESLF